MAKEEVTFPGAVEELAGTLHRPDGEATAAVLMAHCFTCSQDLAIMTRLARVLEESGYAVLRFDFTGLGRSGGDFEDSTFAVNVDDLVAAAAWLDGRGLGPCVIVGHSLGGAAAPIAAGRLPAIEAVAVIGAPSDAAHVRVHLDPEGTERVRSQGCAIIDIGGRPFPITEQFLADLDAFDHELEIAALDRPLLIVHSPEDHIVPISEAERTFALAVQPKTFIPITGADHLLTNPRHTALAGEVLVAWLSRTLPSPG